MRFELEDNKLKEKNVLWNLNKERRGCHNENGRQSRSWPKLFLGKRFREGAE